MSLLGFVLGLPFGRHEWNMKPSHGAAAFVQPFSRPWRCEPLLNDAEDICFSRNRGVTPRWCPLRRPSILTRPQTRSGQPSATNAQLVRFTIRRSTLSRISAPSCGMSQTRGGMEPDLEGSETADDEEETVKPLGQISPHFESGAATNIWVTQLGVRLNLTADQVSSVMSSPPVLLASLSLLSAKDIDQRLEAFAVVLGKTETLKNVLLEYPHLLLIDFDAGIEAKLKWLMKVGLTAAEACGLLATYAPLSGVTLEVMQEGIALLSDELEVAPQHMAKIILGKPSILTSCASTGKLSLSLEPRLRFYKDVLRLSKQELTSLVKKDPSVLRVSVTNLQQKMHFFMEELGMRRLQLTQIIKSYPQMLGLSVDKKLRPNVMYMEIEVGIPRDPLKRILTSSPWLLSHSVDANLKPKVKWMTVNLLLRRDQLIKLFIQRPQVLSLSVENNLAPKISWIQDTFGITTLEVRDMIMRNPSLLLSNTENTIKPKMKFFEDELGMARARLLKILVKFPTLLTYSTDTMRAKISFLKKRFSLEDDDVKRLVDRCPQILGYAVESIDSRVVFLALALEASPEQARDIVLKYPQVLNLSVEKNLRLKIHFFTQVLGASDRDVRDAIVASPSILGYSLTKRLNPRVKVMRSIGVEPVFNEHLWLVSSYSNLRFSKWAEKRLVESLGAGGRGDVDVRSRMKALRAMLQDT